MHRRQAEGRLDRRPRLRTGRLGRQSVREAAGPKDKYIEEGIASIVSDYMKQLVPWFMHGAIGIFAKQSWRLQCEHLKSKSRFICPRTYRRHRQNSIFQRGFDYDKLQTCFDDNTAVRSLGKCLLAGPLSQPNSVSTSCQTPMWHGTDCQRGDTSGVRKFLLLAARTQRIEGSPSQDTVSQRSRIRAMPLPWAKQHLVISGSSRP